MLIFKCPKDQSKDIFLTDDCQKAYCGSCGFEGNFDKFSYEEYNQEDTSLTTNELEAELGGEI